MMKHILLTGFVTAAATILLPSYTLASENEPKRVTCSFHDQAEKGSVHCDAEADVCVPYNLQADPGQIASSKPCEGNLRVRCEKPKGGYFVYDDGVVVTKLYEKLVLQGITSAENPFPPSIFLKKDFRSGSALLNAGGRTIRGECRFGSGAHD